MKRYVQRGSMPRTGRALAVLAFALGASMASQAGGQGKTLEQMYEELCTRTPSSPPCIGLAREIEARRSTAQPAVVHAPVEVATAASQAPSGADVQAAQGTPAFDPVWGQYTGLIGAHARAGVQQVRWYWAVPGQELVQEYFSGNRKKVSLREVIKPGPTSGSLVLTSDGLLTKPQWLGTVQPDGRVLFVGKGPLSNGPYLAGRAKDGAWELTPVELKDGRVVAEKPASKYARFVPFDPSGGNAAQVASAPATTAPAASAATTATVATAGTAAPAPAAAFAPMVQPDTPEIALLRSVIEGFRTGKMPYDRMEPATAEAMRKEMGKIGAGWAKVDETRSIEAGWPMQPYRFLATHGDEHAEWRMDLSPGGRIVNIHYRPVTAEHVAAVRNFGTLAALAGKPFIAHHTHASFALEAGGNVMVMNGSWGTVRLHRNPAGGLDVVLGPGHNSSKAVATMQPDGKLSLELSYRGGFSTATGTRRHLIKAYADGSGFHEEQYWRNGGITLVGRSYDFESQHWFYPLNAQNVAEQARYAAQARAERARERAEEQADRQAMFSSFMHNVQEVGDMYQRQAEQTRAYNEQMQQLAQVAQQAERRQAEAERAVAAAQSSVSGAAPSPQPVHAAPMQPRAPASTPYRSLSGSGTGSWETSGGRSSSPSAGQASTRNDARTCVSPPVTSRHSCGSLTGYKGIVSNTCSVPVDVRMCFMTASGWNCQTRYGLGAEQTWEPGWCHANTGEVFHSVRYSDSREPLASP